ncbi:hypothetical protein B1R32_104189 [Abditibacterium utsteinense]|uniref:Uncharacterized protein n=1 Tax=Abditibacterium utsteinense TaxID=1960156 RepID=A0A2S8SV77_9BACT|nr:hypothetical protein B1R32_104189 [Abditibacterium utsteinense]
MKYLGIVLEACVLCLLPWSEKLNDAEAVSEESLSFQ